MKNRQTPSILKNKTIENDVNTMNRRGLTSDIKGELRDSINLTKEEWENEQKKLEREWYDMDDGFDEERENDKFGMSADYVASKELKLKKLSNNIHQKMSARARQFRLDYELWENNRMVTGGAVQQVKYSEDFDESSETKVHILVRNIVPPFLDGRTVFTKQPEPVIPVKDLTCDLAIISKKGSKIIRQRRLLKEQQREQKQKMSLADTQMGNLLGVKSNKEIDQVNENDDDIFKDQKFNQHMKNIEASSNFAKSLSVLQQKQYLPVFAVKQEVYLVVLKVNIK